MKKNSLPAWMTEEDTRVVSGIRGHMSASHLSELFGYTFDSSMESGTLSTFGGSLRVTILSDSIGTDFPVSVHAQLRYWILQKDEDGKITISPKA